MDIESYARRKAVAVNTIVEKTKLLLAGNPHAEELSAGLAKANNLAPDIDALLKLEAIAKILSEMTGAPEMTEAKPSAKKAAGKAKQDKVDVKLTVEE